MTRIRLWWIVGSSLLAIGGIWSCGVRMKQDSRVNSSLAHTKKLEEQVLAQALVPANQAWISRVIRTLHPGRRATAEQIAKYLEKPKGEVVDELMLDPAFSEMVLDYSLVFLGQAPNPNRSLEEFVLNIEPTFNGSSLAALHAAYQYATNGEYLALLDYFPSIYVTKLAPPSRRIEDYKNEFSGLPDLPDAENLLKGTDSQIRQGVIAHVTQLANELEAKFTSSGDINTLCPPPADSKNQPINPPIEILNRRISAAANHLRIDVWAKRFFSNPLDEFFNACDYDTSIDTKARVEFAKTAFVKVNSMLRSLPLLIADFERRSATAASQGLASLVPLVSSLVPPELKPARTPDALSLEFFFANNNSSTNFNRRRGAAILKRYFCDNLVPLEVSLSSNGRNHSSGRHASEPACQACHYKLDPMAGFFRSKGAGGIEFLNPSPGEREMLNEAKGELGIPPETAVGDFLVFDDRAVVSGEKLNDYLENWKKIDGSGPSSSNTPSKSWNVGYIRSLSHPERNDYGSNLEDLFGIIRRAPEVKRCMTQRLADYIMGTGLRYDPAWIDTLAQPLIAAGESGQGSNQALRDTVKFLVLSNTFAARDPDPTMCYDRMDPSSPVPCEVASIIQQSCAQSCHSSAVKMGHLALDTWIPDTSRAPLLRGQFDHRDASGALWPPATSFARIKQRIMSGDPNVRMPPQEIDQRPRTELYLWLEAREKEALQ